MDQTDASVWLDVWPVGPVLASGRDTLETGRGLDLHNSVGAAIERLAALAHRARRQADGDRRPVLACASVTCPGLDPLTLFERGGSDAGTRMLFLRPDDGFGLAGVGEAWSLVSAGPDRFAHADGAWRAIAGRAVTSGDGAPIAL